MGPVRQTFARFYHHMFSIVRHIHILSVCHVETMGSVKMTDQISIYLTLDIFPSTKTTNNASFSISFGLILP